MSNTLFFDLETTGLDPLEDSILEIGLVVADEDFRELDSLSVVIDYGVERGVLESWMANEFVLKMHTDSGLFDDIMRHGVTMPIARGLVTGWVAGWFPEGEIEVGGSGIDRFDTPFLREHFPAFAARFHFRTLDTSSTRALMKRAGAPIPPQTDQHRAVPDARWSLAVARSAIDIFKGATA